MEARGGEKRLEGFVKLQEQSKYPAHHFRVNSTAACSLTFIGPEPRAFSMQLLRLTVDSFVMQFSTSQEHVYWIEIYSSAMLWQGECFYRTRRLHRIDLTALNKIKGLQCHGSDGYTNAADSVPVHGVKHWVTGQPHYTAACGMQMHPSSNSTCTQSSVKIANSNICKNVWDIHAKFGGASKIQ